PALGVAEELPFGHAALRGEHVSDGVARDLVDVVAEAPLAGIECAGEPVAAEDAPTDLLYEIFRGQGHRRSPALPPVEHEEAHLCGHRLGMGPAGPEVDAAPRRGAGSGRVGRDGPALGCWWRWLRVGLQRGRLCKREQGRRAATPCRLLLGGALA